MYAKYSPLWSRRAFLTQASLSGAFLFARARPLRAAGPVFPSSAGCQFQAHPPFSPDLAKFISRIPAGTDEFLCEKYAQDLDALLSKLSADLRTFPRSLHVLEG